jgi:hypothetical protein
MIETSTSLGIRGGIRVFGFIGVMEVAVCCALMILSALSTAPLSATPTKERRMSAMRHNFNPAANATIGERQDCLLSANLR